VGVWRFLLRWRLDYFFFRACFTGLLRVGCKLRQGRRGVVFFSEEAATLCSCKRVLEGFHFGGDQKTQFWEARSQLTEWALWVFSLDEVQEVSPSGEALRIFSRGRFLKVFTSGSQLNLFMEEALWVYSRVSSTDFLFWVISKCYLFGEDAAKLFFSGVSWSLHFGGGWKKLCAERAGEFAHG
jgi:hypothetical protein